MSRVVSIVLEDLLLTRICNPGFQVVVVRSRAVLASWAGVGLQAAQRIGQASADWALGDGCCAQLGAATSIGGNNNNKHRKSN